MNVKFPRIVAKNCAFTLIFEDISIPNVFMIQIYADNAATTRVSDAAFEAMRPWYKEEYRLNAKHPWINICS